MRLGGAGSGTAARRVQSPTMSCFLSSVFKKAVILVYREHYKLKKKMVPMFSLISYPFHFLVCFRGFRFPVHTRP